MFLNDTSEMYSLISKILRRWPCHRKPERSFVVFNNQLPVCSRCLGLLLGFPLGICAALTGFIDSRLVGALFCLPLLMDAGTQEAGFRNSTNFLRVVTGVSCGIGVGAFIYHWKLI